MYFDSAGKITDYTRTKRRKMSLTQTTFKDSSSMGQSRSISCHSSIKESEFNSDEETTEVKEITKEFVLRQPLPTYPPRVPKAAPARRYKHGLAYVPCPGSFRVRHGFQV